MKHSGDTSGPHSKGEKIIELQSRAEDQAQATPEEGASNSLGDSGQTYDMSRIRELVENAPDMREEKVALLKKMIASGEYKVNAREVADKMIKECLFDDELKS